MLGPVSYSAPLVDWTRGDLFKSCYVEIDNKKFGTIFTDHLWEPYPSYACYLTFLPRVMKHYHD